VTNSKSGNIGKTEEAFFITKNLKTGETPMFNPHDRCFYYVDIEASAIHQYNPQSQTARKWILNKGMVGGVVINGDGTLIGNSQDGLFAFDPKDGSLVMSHPIEPHKPNNRPNDMNVIALSNDETRIVIGCIPIDRTIIKQGEKPGVVYTVKPESLELKPIWDHHVTSNALCGFHSESKNIMFLAETDKNHTPTVWKAHYNAKTDQIENIVPFLTHAALQGGRPDGASIIDINGKKAIAIAALDTNKVIAYDVDTAEPLMHIEAPDNLTLTHAAFSYDSHGQGVCLITSRWQNVNNHEMLGVAVIVPLKQDIHITPQMPVASGYPKFSDIAKGKTVERIAAENIAFSAPNSHQPPAPQPI
jgi:sugar lactone lactonase YvrE